MSGPCEYVIVFKPLWRLLSFFAAWPQRVTNGGRLVRPPLHSPLIVATAALFCVSLWRSWATLMYHVRFHFDMPAGNVPLRLLNLQYGVYGLSFAILASFIFETGRNARYAARWHEFQPELQRVCGRDMQNVGLRRRLRRTALALAVGWPLFITVPVLYAGKDSYLTPAETLFQSYITTVLAFASTNWRMHCAFLQDASDMLVTALAEALRRDTLSRKDVVRFVRTWLQLRALVHAGARSVELTALLNIVALTLTLVLCTFNTMYAVFNGFSKLGVFLIGVGLITGLTHFRIFNGGHRVNRALGERAAMVLAGARLSRFQKDTLMEINTFRLILKAHPVRIKLLGFLPINRPVLGALWVTMSMYLVVMVQSSVAGR